MAVVVGAFIGPALSAATASRALSYLGDEPETCANCHVMNSQYAAGNPPSLLAERP